MDIIELGKRMLALGDVKSELQELKARVSTLERILAGPPCPKCNQPGWHETANEPTTGLGQEFGLRDITYACLRCGYKRTQPPT